MNPSYPQSLADRYLPLITELAAKCLAGWEPASSPGWSLLRAVPAGRAIVLQQKPAERCRPELRQRLAETQTPPVVTDLHGSTRPVYLSFMIHLLAVAGENIADLPSRVMQTSTHQPLDAAPVLWDALVQLDSAKPREIGNRVEAVLAVPGQEGSLHRMAEDESLDGWTFDELTGLHALTHLAIRMNQPRWLGRVKEIARYHLENSQPDNTTTQPWALPAFLLSPDTHSFAEQQLHDAATQARQQGGASRLVTGLILADTLWLLRSR